MNEPIIQIEALDKSFTLHNQGATRFKVLDGVCLEVKAGECLALVGESGIGKSTLLRCLYANYLSDDGSILLRDDGQSWELTATNEREMIRIRREKIAYVSQFLKFIPRVPTLEIVSQPLLYAGVDDDEARQRAERLLQRLRIPKRLWPLSPTTFSGGEQQRINIASELIVQRPLILLDEPTASLDQENRRLVIDLILEAKHRGSAIIGIFHDQDTRTQIADRFYDMTSGVLVERTDSQ
jgi:alpha-D-ribose 1-methylphosphonate 5-triphosphate synthase subunit PhnL